MPIGTEKYIAKHAFFFICPYKRKLLRGKKLKKVHVNYKQSEPWPKRVDDDYSNDGR